VGDWDTFYDAATKYAEAFGRKRTGTLPAIGREAWARLPDLKPGAKEDFSSARFRLTHIMEQAAHARRQLGRLGEDQDEGSFKRPPFPGNRTALRPMHSVRTRLWHGQSAGWPPSETTPTAISRKFVAEEISSPETA